MVFSSVLFEDSLRTELNFLVFVNFRVTFNSINRNLVKSINFPTIIFLNLHNPHSILIFRGISRVMKVIVENGARGLIFKLFNVINYILLITFRICIRTTNVSPDRTILNGGSPDYICNRYWIEVSLSVYSNEVVSGVLIWGTVTFNCTSTRDDIYVRVSSRVSSSYNVSISVSEGVSF